jgi:hypothetical protein
MGKSCARAASLLLTTLTSQTARNLMADAECNELTPAAHAFYCDALRTMKKAGLSFMVGGAYALERYTDIARHTKDLDVFVRPPDCRRVLELFKAKGYLVDLLYPHWLGKVYRGDEFLDVIFSSGNGLAEVDDIWFAHACRSRVMGIDILLCPPEETIWSKAFIMERERYDGADVAHLLRACAADLDWSRLLVRFGEQWRLLLVHLILFGYIYPSHRDAVPGWVMEQLIGRLQLELRDHSPAPPICRGTLLSREQFLADIFRWGYKDPRLRPQGKMSAAAIAHWTAAIK